jgi:hypothetical protein
MPLNARPGGARALADELNQKFFGQQAQNFAGDRE